jgi:hypothetical protein
MLQVSNDLIALERGSDELLLVNSYEMRPLYVERGRERIREVLAAAPGSTRERILATFPSDEALIRLLIDCGILLEDSGRQQPSEVAKTRTARPGQKNRITLYLLMGESTKNASIALTVPGHTRRIMMPE